MYIHLSAIVLSLYMPVMDHQGQTDRHMDVQTYPIYSAASLFKKFKFNFFEILINIDYLVQALIVQTFQPIGFIYRKGNFVNHHKGCSI